MGTTRRLTGVDKAFVLDNRIYGCAGSSEGCEAAPKWHAAGADITSAPPGPWDMGIVEYDDEGQLRIRIYTHECVHGWTASFPLTIGSGADFALSAFMLGKTPLECLEHAGNIDIFTGGPYHTFEYASVLVKPTNRVKKSKTKRGK